MAMETKNRKEQMPKFHKETEALLKKELPKLLKEAYKRNLSKDKVIEIIKETINKQQSNLIASYNFDILKHIITDKDNKHIHDLVNWYLEDYAIYVKMETRLIDYIDKNYKEGRKDGN